MTSMELTFLGTSGYVPTKERNAPGMFLRFKAEGILFDCGEGSQRQMNIAGINRMGITKIFITHWHGDHVGGLMPLLQTMNHKVEHVVEIHGPKGTKKHMKHALGSIFFKNKLELKICEHNLEGKKGKKKIVETEDFIVEAGTLQHSAPTIGYSFIEKDKRRINMPFLRRKGIPEGPHLQKLAQGKSITYKGKKIDVKKATKLVKGKKLTILQDTGNCKNLVMLAKDSDVLVCESTYGKEHMVKAEEYTHMTAQQAALVAHEANVKKLYLTHFSQRYTTVKPLVDEAKLQFKQSFAAHDFLKIKM